MNLENEAPIQNNNKRYNIPRYDARMAKLEAYYRSSMHYEGRELTPAGVCDNQRGTILDRQRQERNRIMQMERDQMKPSAVIRSMAKRVERHKLLDMCNLPELNGTAKTAALFLEVYEHDGQAKIADLIHNDHADKGSLVKTGLATISFSDEKAVNQKRLKQLTLTELGKEKAEYASNVLQNIINRIQTKTQTL